MNRRIVHNGVNKETSRLCGMETRAYDVQPSLRDIKQLRETATEGTAEF